MAYSEALAARVRRQLEGHAGLEEKRMFGGLAFLLRGNLAVGVHGDDLVVRVPPEETEALLREPGAKPFDLSGGRPMKGWLLVGPAGAASASALARWTGRGVAYATSLPPKKASPPRTSKAKAAKARRA